MRKINIYLSIAAMALSAAALSSCREPAQPPIEIPDEAQQIGTGTWDDPMQAWQAAAGTTNGDRTINWVTGYIVGWIDTGVGNTMNEKSFRIGPPCNVNTNMVIAQYPYDEEKWAELGYTWKDCASVQLPSGTVRNALNLMDHPDNFNRLVTIKGTTGSKYCSVYGVRSVTEFNWGDQGIEEAPEIPAVPGTFTKVTEIRSGHKYAFVHGEQVGIPVESRYTYGYIKMQPFMFVTADSFIGTSENAFLFTAEGDGYTIQDCNGRYYYLMDDYTSFQVSSEKPADCYTWKVVYDKDHFNITNIGKPNTVSWSDGYNNFSTVLNNEYKGAGPELYEMTE